MKYAFAKTVLLSFATLSIAQYADYYSNIYQRSALAEAYAEAIADAGIDYNEYLDYLYARAVAPPPPPPKDQAPPKDQGNSWTPTITGAKPIKDTLKCNAQHVCSGEIIV